jgi:hypothetical protein
MNLSLDLLRTLLLKRCTAYEEALVLDFPKTVSSEDIRGRVLETQALIAALEDMQRGESILWVSEPDLSLVYGSKTLDKTVFSTCKATESGKLIAANESNR